LNETAQLALAITIPSALVLFSVATHIHTARRAREIRAWYLEHPEQLPPRRERVLRVLPFALLLAVGTVVFAIVGRWGMVTMGVIGVGAFAFPIYLIATGREDLRGE
jgi:hypothetical protein